MTQKPEPLLWLSDARGIYIPHNFANCFIDRTKTVSGVSAEDWTILEHGPDHEWYWETWDDVLRDAVVTDENGVKYTLHQDGDLWLIPQGMEWSDENEFFAWPETEPEYEHEDKLDDEPIDPPGWEGGFADNH